MLRHTLFYASVCRFIKVGFMLQEHLKIKEEDRNQAWEEKFFKLFSESNLQILSEDP